MADDKTSRYQRSNDPYRRDPSSSGSGAHTAGSDPLAELARLIGQNDPFTAPPRSTEPRDPQPTQQPKGSAMSDWRKAAAAMPPYETYREETLRRQQPARSEPNFAPLETDSRREPYLPSPSEDPEDHQYDTRHDTRREYETPPQPYYRREPQFTAAEQFHSQAEEEQGSYAAAPQPGPAQPPYFEDGAPLAAHDEELYDDPPHARRSGGLITAVTLIGCAMIGTAGAYGYRTYYVSPGTDRTPPTITAETAPSKVVSAGDPQSNKSIQDRVLDQNSNERIVSREEQPVDIPTATTNPRVVLPAPVQPSQSVFPPPPPPRTSGTAAPAAAPPPAPSAGGSEPRRIRTLTIRPDGTDLSGRPVGGISESSAPPSAATATRSTPTAKSPPARNGGPISLDPQSSAAAEPPPAPRERVATAPAQPPAPRAPAEQGNAPTGGYAVQLSSQRSEAEAQAAFRSLQAKYPDQLGSRSSFVKRVELGAKGVYYRALVGPFASSSDAGEFCSELKAAGGQCIIQRN